MSFSDYVVYVDESGTSTMKNIDPDYPVFVLAFCIFEKERYCREVVPSAQAFKFRWWGHDMVVLHEAEIRRAKAPFVFLNKPEVREAFRTDLAMVLEAAPCTIIAAVIHKQRHAAQYKYPRSPYELALTFCMERTYAFLKDRRQTSGVTHVVAEARGQREDDALELEFRRIRDGGNHWGKLPFEIVFAKKAANSTGLQIADLVGRPIGLRHLRPDQANRTYDVVDRKFRRSPAGKLEGWGMKTFP